MYLPTEIFTSIVAHAPLVSIDLIVRNPLGEVLLGMRKNRPAQGFWFVPGGRIQKVERISQAFSRLTEEELGMSCDLDQARFAGVYEHLYNDNFSGKDFSTHYVVLAYEIDLGLEKSFPDQQHADYCWLSPADLLRHSQVHENSKAYFVD